MINKIKLAVAGSVSLLGTLAMSAHAQMSTTTLGTNIDSLSASAVDYVAVLITNYWPFVLGFLILIGVIGFGKRAVLALFR